MKKLLFSLVVLAFVGTTHADAQKKQKSCCDKKSKKSECCSKPIVLSNFKDSVSYAIGTDIANNFKTNGIEVNIEKLFAGMQDVLSGNDSLISPEVFQQLMMRFQQEMQKSKEEKSLKEANMNKELGKKFLEENAKKEGVMTTASGLQYKVLRAAEGPKPSASSKVRVHYEGKLIDGKIFDSSYQRGESISFGLNQVIKGWTEGLQLMSVGSMYELYIPSELGYGDRSMQTIPAGSTLIFKVELLGIE